MKTQGVNAVKDIVLDLTSFIKEKYNIQDEEKLKFLSEFVHEFFPERNLAWFKKITPLLKKESPIFICVSMGHLWGNTGLMRQFNDAGFSLEEISISQNQKNERKSGPGYRGF